MMKLLAISVVFLLGCSAANRPGAGPGPTPRAGESVVAWTEDLPLQQGFALYFRNVSSSPLRISSLTLYECLNISGGCYMTDPGIVLQPGEIRRARTIEPSDTRKPFSYRYRYQWTPVAK